MDATKHLRRTLASLASVILLAAAVAGCEGDEGKDGTAGTPGTDGTPGLNCWDLNQNGVADLATEDLNLDGVVDVLDCRTPSGGYDAVSLHQGYFTEHTYTGTPQCLNCHGKIGDDVMTTAHWNWEGRVGNIVGLDPAEYDTPHGKKDLINNFCQAVPSNEGRCSQCHIGYGWDDKNFDFEDPSNIDCLACHDQTGTYQKVAYPTAEQPLAGGPAPSVNLTNVARSVGLNGGVPPRSACVFCHSRAGGDDNVKHGDISTRMALRKTDDPAADPNTYLGRDEDVHMGFDPVTRTGGNMTCVACHQADKDSEGNFLSHEIAGFTYYTDVNGDELVHMKQCEDCHLANPHVGTDAERMVENHPRLACQVCHIPAIARKVSTYTDWRWASAGFTPPADNPTETHPADCAKTPLGVTATGAVNRTTYNKMKGCFTWGTSVRPTLRYYNGKWNRKIMGINDGFDPDATPVDLGSPAATYRDPEAKIYPFKLMTGNQPADAVNDIVLVPHLYGPKGGPNPYWTLGMPQGYAGYNWLGALTDGAWYSPAYHGGVQTFSGQYAFVDTVMLLKVDHEVAPKEQAYGKDSDCGDCHLSDAIDWPALGWTDDPVDGGTQTLP